jgi:outer membrane protein TolC
MRLLPFVFLSLSVLPRLDAQAPARSDSVAHGAPVLTLQAAIDAALSGNSQIRAEWLRGETLRGDRIARNAPFDLQLQSLVQQARDKKPLTATDYALQQGTTYQVALSRQLRSGITVSPTVAVTRNRLSVPGAAAAGRAEAGLGIAVPLLYNRNGAVTATALRVADLDFEAVRGAWRTTVSSALNSVTGAYWSYVAAIQRLSVQRDAEARAQRLLDETAQLVAKDERAPADLQQLQATMATRRSARILAEQSVDEARVQLGTLMGLDAQGVLALGVPATGFPAAGGAPLAEIGTMARLHLLATASRPDLAAARTSNRAFELELQQFRNAQQPKLDLSVNVGYQGFTQGPGFDHLVSPLYSNVPGLNATVQLSYGLAWTHSAALGLVIREAATLEQQRIALRDIERQVTTDVAIAIRGLDRTAAALRESEEAVMLYRVSVENEQRKLRLGMNTLFEVLTAEDALTNALLTAITNRRSHAVALSTLRLATGTIAEVTDGTAHADATRLLTLP